MTAAAVSLSPLEQKLAQTAERQRLLENTSRQQYWQRWGPYLSDRQWGTVREDYSENGTAWEDFSHDQARSRAYRWGEDGILGISDSGQLLCFALALWNGQDPILKERYFGLTGNEGNHGEDVKEYYFYLDSTPTHSYMRGLYKYPHAAYPYNDLLDENRRRGRGDFEYELLDTGVFDGGHYYDVEVEYAKQGPEDLGIRIHVTNRSPDRPGRLHLLPTLWFRNIWSWKRRQEERPQLQWQQQAQGHTEIRAEFRNPRIVREWGLQPVYTLAAEAASEVLVTENDTNLERFGWGTNPSPWVKDGFHAYLIDGRNTAIHPQGIGSKAAPHYVLDLQPGERRTLRLRLRGHGLEEPAFDSPSALTADLDALMELRRREADEFYACVTPLDHLSEDQQLIQRQAFAGLLWSKQFYHLIVKDWLEGDESQPPPPERRKHGRNRAWLHLYNEDIISMPDKWEYPWYAAWDLSFHTIPLALIDPDFAKKQLLLLAREWFMHPNGQLPAYEWNFEDVNPPVHAWASFRVYQMEKRKYGQGDINFLEEIFNKMTIYFTWWVNRKGVDGDNLFSGGFLGLDNIAVFDRSNFNVVNDRGERAEIIQSDGSSWMAMFCLNMLKIASELAKVSEGEGRRRNYDAMASKFLQHFLLIADAINLLDAKAGGDTKIYDEDDQFYYDILRLPPGVIEGGDGRGASISMKVRSMVGLIPLFAVEAIPKDVLETALAGDFGKRLSWFRDNTALTTQPYVYAEREGLTGRFKGGLLLSLVNQRRLRGLLARMLNEEEFLSPYGIRSLSKVHANPYRLPVGLRSFDAQNGQWRSIGEVSIAYAPAESNTALFGGNSNWRGPVWFPVNYLLIESLQKLHMYLGPEFTVPCPTGSGAERQVKEMNLLQVSREISQRLMRVFEQQPDPSDPSSGSVRPVYGGSAIFQRDPNWQRCVLFYEYFHGDNGAGLGASHQTGWTGLVAKLIEQHARFEDPSEQVFEHSTSLQP
jgi:hypothetical protein